MRGICRAILRGIVRDQKNLDLLLTLGKLREQVCVLSAELKHLRLPENTELPYHTQSLRFAVRELTRARRALYHAMRACRRRGVSRRVVVLACNA